MPVPDNLATRAEDPPLASRTPARDKARRFLPQALAGKWSITRLAKEAGVSRNVAAVVMREGSNRSQRAIEAALDRETNRAVGVARRVRDKQIDTAEKLESISEKALLDLEAKARDGELSLRDLETLAKVRKTHWETVKDLAGLSMAEKLAVAQAKGDAAGRGFAGALLDSSTLDIGDGVFDLTDS